MRKHVQIVAGILLLFASNVAFAQVDANTLVKNTVKAFREKNNVEMDFTYSYLNANQEEAYETHEGKAYLQGEAYKVILDDQHTISDGTTIWSYLVDDEEVMVGNASEGTDNTPIKLITTLDKDYTASYTDNKSTIELTNPKGQFKRIIVKFDNKNSLSQMRIYADDGSSMDITIKEWKYDQKLKDDFFTFDEKAHPEVEIIDMR